MMASQAHASRLVPRQQGLLPLAADGGSPDSANKKQKVEDAVANLGSKDPEWQAKLNVRLLPSTACTSSACKALTAISLAFILQRQNQAMDA